MLNNILGGILGKVVDNAEGILDKVITTDKERDEAKLQLRKVLLDAEKEAFNKEVEDRKDARDLYKDDAIIQKILATLFTVAYFGISFVMFQHGGKKYTGTFIRETKDKIYARTTNGKTKTIIKKK